MEAVKDACLLFQCSQRCVLVNECVGEKECHNVPVPGLPGDTVEIAIGHFGAFLKACSLEELFKVGCGNSSEIVVQAKPGCLMSFLVHYC